MARPTTYTNIIPVRDNYSGTTSNTVSTGAVTLTVSPNPTITEGIIELQYPTNTSKNEMMKFTANSSGSLTITAANRGLGGTTEQIHNASGVTVIMPYSEVIHSGIDTAISGKVSSTDPVLNGIITGTGIQDDDGLSGASATKVASSESIKAYVDAQAFASGSGDVTGPTSSTDNTVARMDGTTGKVVQASLVTIDDSGSLAIPAGQKFGNVDNYATASQAEAEAGTATDKFMTPERTKQFVSANFVKADITVDAAGKGDYTTIADGLSNAVDGDLVYVKSGTYTLTGNVTVKNGVTLIGESKNNTFITASSSKTIAVVNGSGTVVNTGTVSLTQGDATVTGTSTVFAATDAGKYGILTRLLADSTDNHSSLVKIATYASSTSIELDDTYEGVGVSSRRLIYGDICQDVNIMNFTFKSNVQITLSNSNGCSISNCIFEKLGGTEPCISLIGTVNRNTSISNVLVRGGSFLVTSATIVLQTSLLSCDITNCSSIITTTANAIGTLVDGCKFSACNGGLEVGERATVKGCSFQLIEGDFLEMGNSSICANNIFEGENDSPDIAVDLADCSTVSGNIFRDCYTSIRTNDDNSSIFGNTIEDGTIGINVSGDGNSIQGNTIKDTDEDGIIASGNTNIVNGNSVEGAGEFGILASGDENLVTSNMLNGNTDGGVSDTGTSNVTANNITT